MAKYAYKSISEMSVLLQRGEVSPVEIVKECLERIERLQPQFNAFITVMAETAVQEAREAEEEIQQGRWRGPLHGIPVGLKDFFDTAGVRTTAAFAPFKDRVPERNAEVVRRLKGAGAIMLGKLNMHELGMGTTSATSYFGAVHNPWGLEYIAGGSSGGSAAAVAAGLCYATVDTDAVGSCRLPAACCGVVGFKGTYGLISTEGILAGEQADDFILLLSHTAFTCRAVEDSALLLNVLTSEEEREKDYRVALTSAPGRTIGFVQNANATAEIRQACEEAAEALRALGYRIQSVEVPLAFPALDLEHIAETRATISQSLFREVELLLLPTTTTPPLTLEEAQVGGPQALAADNTFFANYYGLPAVSVPCGFTSDGLPLAVQLVGPRLGEERVLQVAYAFQQATPWHTKHPSLAE